MSKLKIYEVPPQSWEDGEYRYQEITRSGAQGGDLLTKLGIETPEGFDFAVRSSGRLILGNLMHVSLVYKNHIGPIINGDERVLGKYLKALPADPESGHERYWLNNRSYIRSHGLEEGQDYPLVYPGKIEIRPVS